MTPAELLSGPTEAQIAALAHKHGGRITDRYRLDDGQPAYLLVLPSHGAKVALLNDLAKLDAFNPLVRRYAEQIVAGASTRSEQVARLHAYVRDHVVHTDEPIETFSPPLWVLRSRVGDCDDTARTLCALLGALGLEARIATLGDPPKHAACQWRAESGAWIWLETTIRAHFGEHPIEAARRLGIRTRPDLR